MLRHKVAIHDRNGRIHAARFLTGILKAVPKQSERCQVMLWANIILRESHILKV